MGRKKHTDVADPVLQDNRKFGVGGYQFLIIFPAQDFVNNFVQDIISQRYKEDVIGDIILQRALPLMHNFCGLSDNSWKQAQKSGRYPLYTAENTVAEFERRLKEIPPEEVHDQLIGFYYKHYGESVRSTIGNLKSSKQKERLVEIFKTFSDKRLTKALMLGEFKGHNLKPKSDGMLHCATRKSRKESHIHIFMRIGDCIGGSQGDRLAQIRSAAEKYPDTDFFFLWDGLEVDHAEIEKINYLYSPSRVHGKGNAVYITTSDEIAEDKLIELFDRL